MYKNPIIRANTNHSFYDLKCIIIYNNLLLK